MVILATSDNEQFTVEKEVAERSVLIKNMLEGGWLIINLSSAVTEVFFSFSFLLPQMLVRAINPFPYPTFRPAF